jgi:succinate-semialdehyde dehydrogenase/glutarate-semialdehyde dehydrogenase
MKNIIGKERLDASSGAVVEVTNPATRALIDTVPNSTVEDVDKVARVAHQMSKVWAKTSMYERGEILKKFVSLVERDKASLAKLLSDETGKPLKEAIIEVSNTKIFVEAYVEKAKHLYGINIPTGMEPGNESTIQFTTRSPLGVVACIIPFNFPLDLFGQKVPSALIMGNSVIIKPSTSNPLTLAKYTELLLEAGVPAGVVNCIHGEGQVVGQALAAHPLVHAVSLTGSTKAGIETMRTASQNLTHVMLELGGNDAFILLEDGDIDLAVEETVWGRLYNTGQVCCASKRFLIQNSVKKEFIEKMVAKIRTLRIGMPEDLNTDIGCLISEQAAIKVEEQVRKTLASGATLVYGGRRNGAFVEPTILDNVTKDMDVAKDMEIFGPVIPIIGFDTLDEAIEIANQSSFGLSSNIITKDMKKAFKAAELLEAGGVVINGASFFRSVEMPFGGWKQSGIGNEGISTTLEEMSKLKTIVLKNVLK